MSIAGSRRPFHYLFGALRMLGTMRYEQTVTALAARIAEDRLHDAEQLPPAREIAAGILQQQQRMPDYLRLPIALLTRGFDSAGLVHHGGTFSNASPAAQRRQLQAWRASSLGPCRNLVRFYESLVLLVALADER